MKLVFLDHPIDQWCLRMLLGIKCYQFVRNDDVRRLTKQPKLTAIIQSHRLTLFGHIIIIIIIKNVKIRVTLS